MIVVAVIALLAAIAVPEFMLRSRKHSHEPPGFLNDLRFIDSAVDQYALENGKIGGATVSTVDWTHYLKPNSNLYLTGADIFGDDYGSQTVDSLPSVPTSARATLSDVADTAFWSPYN